MKIAAIVPSAGSGKRMHSKRDKLLIKICNREIIFYTLNILQNAPEISEVIIAVREKNVSGIKRLIAKEAFTKVKCIVLGGESRSQSVANALTRVSPNIDYILVHDAARPLVTQGLIRKTVNGAKRYGTSISAVKIAPTIKEAGQKESLVRKTLDRRFLWEAQTPQVIKKDILICAYKKAGRNAAKFTDEASLVENMGKDVKIVNGSYNNIKITRPEDLVIAEALMKVKSKKVKGKR